VPTELLGRIRLGRWLEPDPTPEIRWEAPLDGGTTLHPTQRLQRRLHPWSSYLVVPVFALANAGVVLDRDLLASAVGSPITLGVLAGLVLGKLVGIVGGSLLAVRFELGPLPRLVTRQQLAAAATLAGIGLTVALSSPTSPSPSGWPRMRPRWGFWSPRRRPPRSAGCYFTCQDVDLAAGRPLTWTHRLAAARRRRNTGSARDSQPATSLWSWLRRPGCWSRGVGSMLVEDDPPGRIELMTSTDASLHTQISWAGARSVCSQLPDRRDEASRTEGWN
jgi:hypothetical protein